ncbi:DUF3141 domain-containing protein [Dyella sedimenti]|uniref:DUF3141 domain-containing protein n=1 Tax=Dyella sedimenti TaxID=2919947 RepID=UPI001FAA9BEE|nr:DUF3141 domain-containing protein [Dyella sedimenti]
MKQPQTASAGQLPGLGHVPWLEGALAYTVDAWQRSVLYADVMRERGNQYQAHLREKIPNVLDFPSELVMSGLDLPRPVNYGMVRILPAAGSPSDPAKRPFVVVDPRAGHGPGIGGFKPDSEIGAALKAGHPCYFVGFLPDPVPGQTVEDVMRAEAAFLRRVAELHPDSPGKPAVIGNCQAGWQVLMTAAVWPELFGPIIVAGAPLSYWAGENPMRYAGGLMGGSWLTAATSDAGAGRFDGAWLVQNFENLDPANTLWAKQYNLYAKVDTEAPRYLGFEKYWGGHVFLNDVEMQYIVDNLFIGNRLSSAELFTSDGVRIDLRNVRSPIVVFCSYGDNITTPPQALGWITDLYQDDNDIVGYDQTIVYATHDSIGHLGIFVSGSIGRREHREFTNNIDLIDLLPAGLYQATVEDKAADLPHGELIEGPYLLSVRRRGIEDVRAIVQPDPASDRHFAAARRLSEINLALYRNFLQPWLRAVSTPSSARWLQALHPLRVGYEWWSDEHPLAPIVASLAEQVREERLPVDPDHPLWQAQARNSQVIAQALDRFRDRRDEIYALLFHLLYGSPWLQALAGQSMGDHASPRPHPGDSPEHRAFLAGEMARLHAQMGEGGLAEAAIRALFYVLRQRGEGDERQFRYALRLQQEKGRPPVDMGAFRHLVRSQARLLRHDPQAAIDALPVLLARAEPGAVAEAAHALAQVINLGDPPSGQEQASLQQMLDLFDRARQAAGHEAPVH